MDNNTEIRMQMNYRPVGKLVFVFAFWLIGFAPGNIQAQTAVEFQGDAYLIISDHTDLHLNEFTLSCWIMKYAGGDPVAGGISGEEILPVLGRGYHSNVNTNCINYRLGIREDDQVLYLEWESRKDESEDYQVHSVKGFTGIKDSTWHHVAATSDGRNLNVYLDGCLEASLEVFHAPDESHGSDLSIATVMDDALNPSGAFHGRMDVLRIYNRALSPQQLHEIINSESMDELPGLVAGFDMNQSAGGEPVIIGSITQDHVTSHNLHWAEGSHMNALLPPLLQAVEGMQIGIITDPQYCDCETPGWAERVYRKSLDKLPAAIAVFNDAEVDFSITLGDIIDTFFVSFDSILPLYNASEAPHYFVLGNHDFAIDDSLKDEVPGMLNMPGYYYELEYDNWRFLVLDGTELARYTRVLHPELGQEGDSLYAVVSGEINDKPWNGGIGRTQQAWMKERIEDAGEKKQHVMLFCHFPVLPDSAHLNLWNKDSIVSLLSAYDHVVAYINGHNHYGGYDLRGEKHFVTQYGMVETEDSNSYSLLGIYPNYLKFKGYGYNPDRILRYKNTFRHLPFPRLQDSVLHFYHDSSDFVTTLFLPGFSREQVNFNLIGGTSESDNSLFRIRSDSLFLNGTPEYKTQRDYLIHVGAMDHLFDSISSRIHIHLDTTVAVQRQSLKDTVLLRDSLFSIMIDSLFADYSRGGLEILCNSSDTGVLHCVVDNEYVHLYPLRYGMAKVQITAFDVYTDYILIDSFTVWVTDPSNHPPEAIEQGLQISYYLDTLRYAPDSLFSDPDGDSLSLVFIGTAIPGLHREVQENNHIIIWADTGLHELVTVVADDRRGGSDTLILELKFNTPPNRRLNTDRWILPANLEVMDILLDTVYFDPDGDTLEYEAWSETPFFSILLEQDILHIYPMETGESGIVLNIRDGFGGFLTDTMIISIYPEDRARFIFWEHRGWHVFPNPATELIHVVNEEVPPGKFHFGIFNESGEIVYTGKHTWNVEGRFSLNIPLSGLADGVYWLHISSAAGKEKEIRFVRISGR